MLLFGSESFPVRDSAASMVTGFSGIIRMKLFVSGVVVASTAYFYVLEGVWGFEGFQSPFRNWEIC